jgi:mono/diheme cytochrome c family protein
MIGTIIGIIVLAALAILFVWLAIRAWHSRRALVRWLGVVFSGLLALVFTAAALLAIVGVYKETVPPHAYSTGTAAIPVTGGQDAVTRGGQIASLCVGCHSSTGNLPLDGSKENFMAGGPPLGVLYAPDLTPSGPIKDWTDAQVMRALREGVDNQGRPLLIMPADGFHGMSDADAMAVVAYLRSQTPSGRNVPPKNLNAFAYAVLGSGVFPNSAQDPITTPVTAPKRGPTAEYGQYITSAFACKSCHGPNLAGVQGGFGPAAPDLRAIIPHWSQADFVTFFRTGLAPGGVNVNPENMPWNTYSNLFTDEDLQGLYLYLHSLAPVK